MSIKLNQAAIERLIKKRILEAWAEVVNALDQEFERVIRDPNEFNDLGFTDQDIVDTERFVESLKIDPKPTKTTWEWDPVSPDDGYHYASALYFGFMAFGKHFVAGRPWAERAIEHVKPLERFQSELRKRGIDARIVRKNQFQSP